MVCGPVLPIQEGSHVDAPHPFFEKTISPPPPAAMYALLPLITGDAQFRLPGMSPTQDSASFETFPALRIDSLELTPVWAAFPWNCDHDAAAPAPACAPGATARDTKDTANTTDAASERTRLLTTSPFG